MTTLKFKTNVSCGGCIVKVTPHLDKVEGMIKWNVDTSNLLKILTVEATGIGPDKIVKAMKDAGYKADLISAE